MIDIEILNRELGSLKPPKNKINWIDVRDTMFVHTRGKNPGRILTDRRPNEDPEIQKYRLSIYEPITKGSMNRAIDKLYRIFISANFSIKVSEELSVYLDEKKFEGQYFYSFIQKYVVRRMIEDPNGFLAWIPSGEGLSNPSVKVEVSPVLIDSTKIVYFDEDAISWESSDEDEKTEIVKNGKKVREGRVIYTLTDEGFYRHEQYGNDRDKKFELFEIYRHEIGFLPAIVLGGDATDEDYFESYFSPFIPFGNEAIRQYSDWQGVMTTSAFPYREEVAETCSAPGCRDGVCYDNKVDEHIACRVCKGTGRVISRSPFGVFLRPRGGNVLDGDSSAEPMVRFVSPPVDIIEYSGKAWETLLKKAEESLHLTTIDEAQSGTAKMIDREDSFMVLTKISNNIFDEIIYRSLLIIEKYRNVSDPIDPLIIKPISFSMKTEEDLIDEINSLTDKNAPVAFLVETTKDLAKKRFSGNKAISRMVEILVSYDPIYHVSTKDKQVLLASGIIKKDDILKSLYSYKVLTSLVTTNGTEYLEKPLTEIFTDLDTELKKVIDTYSAGTIIEIPA